MRFLFSGEGVTDFGQCDLGADFCQGSGYLHGPMAVIVDQVVEQQHNYSPLEATACHFISKHELINRSSELKTPKKAMRLPGKKQERETRYYFNNARMLARIANEFAAQANDTVVAVLFRDSDGTASAGRGEWHSKRQSMLDGFEQEGFNTGVPMIPKPKSEAWLLCAAKTHPYQNCGQLEDRSGNDDSPNSLKAELESRLGEQPTRENLNARLVSKEIDIARIDMPSFKAFRDRLIEVLTIA